MNEKPKPRRRWFQFRLRTLLLLVTIASAGFGWLGYKVRQTQRQEAAVAALQKLGCFVNYDYQLSTGYIDTTATPPGPIWLRNVLGDHFFANVDQVEYLGGPRLKASDLEHLREFTQLSGLSIQDAQITDAGLVCLRGLTRLQDLCLIAMPITDAGLVHLHGLTQLDHLEIHETRITDNGRRELQKALPKLQINRLILPGGGFLPETK